MLHTGPASTPVLPSAEPAPSADALPASELIVVPPLLLVLPELDPPELLDVPELEGIPELEPRSPDPDPLDDVIPVPEEPEPPVKPELEPEPPGMFCPASGRSGEPDEPQPLNETTRAVANTTELRMVLPPVTVMIPGETERIDALAYSWESGCFSYPNYRYWGTVINGHCHRI